MPNFNTSDRPIGQDNYPHVAATSDDPRPDSGVVGYEPTIVADWDGGADPGNVDAALDQLAERVADNESSIGGLSNDHGSLLGLADDDHTQYLRADGTRDLAGSLLVSAANELRFRDGNQRVYSSAAEMLDLEAQTELRLHAGGSHQATLASGKLEFDQGGGDVVDLQWGLLNALLFRVNGNTEITMKPNRMEFNNGGTDTWLDWSNNGQLAVGRGLATTIAMFRDAELDVDGIVRGDGLRADEDSPGGTSGTITITSDSLVANPFGTKASLNQLPTGYSNAVNAGWMKVMIGTNAAVVPYWYDVI